MRLLDLLEEYLFGDLQTRLASLETENKRLREEEALLQVEAGNALFAPPGWSFNPYTQRWKGPEGLHISRCLVEPTWILWHTSNFRETTEITTGPKALRVIEGGQTFLDTFGGLE